MIKKTSDKKKKPKENANDQSKKINACQYYEKKSKRSYSIIK
jgi:hypothetical protein